MHRGILELSSGKSAGHLGTAGRPYVSLTKKRCEEAICSSWVVSQRGAQSPALPWAVVVVGGLCFLRFPGPGLHNNVG